MIYLFLSAIALLLCAEYNGIMDSIMFYRTHAGQHPYRDYWHLCKYITRTSLISFGVAFVLAVQSIGWYALLVLLLIPLMYVIWKKHAFAEPRDKYYIVDETLRISTGIAWLDKILGFHH